MSPDKKFRTREKQLGIRLVDGALDQNQLFERIKSVLNVQLATFSWKAKVYFFLIKCRIGVTFGR